MNRHLPLLPVAAFVFVLAGCESKITDENFALVKAGMTQNEVEKSLGKGKDETPEGTSISGAGIATSKGGALEIIRYKDGTKSIVVTYKDGKVQDFVKVGF